MTQLEIDELNKVRAVDNGNMPIKPILVGGGSYVSVGLTKREYMATKILSGLLSDSEVTNFEYEVSLAVSLTDKLLIELNRK